MTDLLMPRLSDSMEEGTLLMWLKQDGDAVAVGDELVEIETDKATMTYAAETAGVLRRIGDEGDSFAVGAVIGAIDDADGEADASDAAQAAGAAPPPEGAQAPAPVEASPVTALPQPITRPQSPTLNGGRLRASPLARRMAERHGVELGAVLGTGPNGRITRRDVASVAGVVLDAAPAPAPVTARAAPKASGVAAASAAPAAPLQDGPRGAVSRQPLTRLQQVIARRMVEAATTVPDFQVATDVDMGKAIALRKELKAVAGDEPAPSFNDFVIKAAAVALRDHPRANGRFDDGAFALHERINVGMAVAADDALVVPTVFDADTRSLAEIARETRRLAERVRSGTIAPAELDGGTFTVSNLGMFGMTFISPVINGGQAAILGVGAMREVLLRRDGEVVDQTLMTLTLTSDHRILYGADASRALGRIRELLETPLKLAL